MKTIATAAPADDGGDYVLDTKLDRDLKKTAAAMTTRQARILFNSFYTLQRTRMQMAQRVDALEKQDAPNGVLGWIADKFGELETQMGGALGEFVKTEPMAQWAMSHKGVGPLIAAGLAAFVDIEKCDTAGAVWRFAGYDPTVIWPTKEEAEKWLKGQTGKTEAKMQVAAKHFGRTVKVLDFYTRFDGKGKERKLTDENLAKAIARQPHNAAFKVLCYKLSDSFNKLRNNPDAYYGKLLAERHAFEKECNEAGKYSKAAERALSLRPNHAQKKTYKEGKLPDGHILMRARRWVVKLFLAHYFDEAYRRHHGKAPPLPYPIAHLGHVHFIPPANE